MHTHQWRNRFNQNKINALSSVAFAVCLCLFGGMWVFVALSRMGYPFAVEWTETASLTMVQRILTHNALYTPPTHEFTPLIYTPLYFYLSAWAAQATGHLLSTMRTVSTLGTTLALVSLVGICRAWGVRLSGQLLAPALFIATYGFTGFWLDLGRVDAVFMGLLLASYWSATAPSKTKRLSGLLTGALLCAACATKQQGLVAVPCLLGYLFLEKQFVKGGFALASFAFCFVVAFTFLQYTTSGWFAVYIFDIPRAHPTSAGLPDLFTQALFLFLPTWAAIGLGFFCAVRKHPSPALQNLRSGITRLCLITPLFLMSYLSVAKQWGYVNGLIPAMAAFALLGAWAMQVVGDAMGYTGKAAKVMATAIFILQFFLLRYDAQAQLPTQQQRQAAQKLVMQMQTATQPIFAPISQDIMLLSNQSMVSHDAANGDVFLAVEHSPVLRQMLSPYLPLLSGKRRLQHASTLLLSNAPWYNNALQTTGDWQCKQLSEAEQLRTLTGGISVLQRVCVKRE